MWLHFIVLKISGYTDDVVLAPNEQEGATSPGMTDRALTGGEKL